MVDVCNKIVLSHKKDEISSFTATCTGLEDIRFNKISQTQMDKYHTFSLICGRLRSRLHRNREYRNITKAWGGFRIGIKRNYSLVKNINTLDKWYEFSSQWRDHSSISKSLEGMIFKVPNTKLVNISIFEMMDMLLSLTWSLYIEYMHQNIP